MTPRTVMVTELGRAPQACRLLVHSPAHGAQHEGFGYADAVGRRTAGKPDPRRALLRGVDVHPLADFEPLGAAERVRRRRAVGCAVRSHRAAFAADGDPRAR